MIHITARVWARCIPAMIHQKLPWIRNIQVILPVLIQMRKSRLGQISQGFGTELYAVLYAYADLARKNGLTLNDEEKAEIDERVSSIKKSADNNDFSLDRYIQKIYGKGVTEKVLRAALEDSTLASKYAQQKQSEISDAITNDEIVAEYEANPNNYTTLSVSAFKVSANANVDSNATDEEKRRQIPLP